MQNKNNCNIFLFGFVKNVMPYIFSIPIYFLILHLDNDLTL